MPTKPTKTTTNYKITIEILGEKWNQEGKTIESTLKKFPLTWEKIKGKGILTVSKGNREYIHLFNSVVLKRIFTNKIATMIWAKRLKLLLDAGKSTNIPKNYATQDKG